eukprot:6208860-Pleurochrysis_carterae.AAC.9
MNKCYEVNKAVTVQTAAKGAPETAAVAEVNSEDGAQSRCRVKRVCLRALVLARLACASQSLKGFSFCTSPVACKGNFQARAAFQRKASRIASSSSLNACLDQQGCAVHFPSKLLVSVVIHILAVTCSIHARADACVPSSSIVSSAYRILLLQILASSLCAH